MGVFAKRITQVVQVPEHLSLHKDYNKTSVTIARLSYGQETALERERFHALRSKMGEDLLAKGEEIRIKLNQR